MQLTEEERFWLEGLKPFDRGNVCAILAVFALFKVPHSYLDVGCGTGAMVKAARQLGVDAYGVDILPHEEPYLVKHDLREKFDLGRQFDLITCIETAEHLPEESADTLCDMLEYHLAGDGINSSGLLIFTAAKPFQRGEGHINCQSAEYWREKLESRKLKYDLRATNLLASVWPNTQMVTHWLEENLQIFSR